MLAVADGVNVVVIAGPVVAFVMLVAVLDGYIVFEVAFRDRVVVAAVSVIIVGDVAVDVGGLDAVVSAVSAGVVVVD